ncbi:MAG: hypothetical protein SVN78_00090 [Deferribacterota bacterium]|nr:hypothetical protein [Deferribacterota bacterium]
MDKLIRFYNRFYNRRYRSNYNTILLILIFILAIYGCGGLYLEYNSDGIYETPMMRYEIKETDNNDLNIKITNISGDTTMRCDLIFYFKNNDNETVKTKSYICPILYSYFWKSTETTIKTPPEATKVYIRYNEYDYPGGPVSRFNKHHRYSYFSTIYMRLRYK